eukprot:13461703-Alexandrium_andersonii.AAC.1
MGWGRGGSGQSCTLPSGAPRGPSRRLGRTSLLSLEENVLRDLRGPGLNGCRDMAGPFRSKIKHRRAIRPRRGTPPLKWEED